ncbi:hypothetical protein QFZ81_000386 [Paenibacillus sp. V4I9]|uniref:hypothetical protein n=1 Tax=Paenibacillus sp. V4I9 TaxID=3042308 RepID=UPI0027838DDF|nr:hypothetical protein [Paenibacillus sp. V4I9]MDQ0885298.1 hypothetical protein [Paenibacillus sp. V4I9]
MALFTGVIENRHFTVTNLVISLSNEGDVPAEVELQVYRIPTLGFSTAILYVLHTVSLAPFNEVNSIITFDNVFAKVSRFAVRVFPSGLGGANIVPTVGLLDDSANVIRIIKPGDFQATD